MVYERIYRDVDGEHIPGKSRYVFVKNGSTYFLTNLTVYADALIDCRGLMTFDELRAQLASGMITTDPPDNGDASAHGLARWRFAQPHSWVDADMLVGELLDVVDKLNKRPDSVARCLQLIDRHLADQSEENRLAIRAAYFAIPAHLRRGMLGDMDRKDQPVRCLISDIGRPGLRASPDDMVVSESARLKAIAYFVERAGYAARAQQERPAFMYDDRQSPTVMLNQMPYARRWPEQPDVDALTPDYPAQVTAFGRSYPTITHAILALSTSDSEWHDRIAQADGPKAARKAAQGAPWQADWADRRLAVMATLLRQKFAQHPELAEILLATGDGRITYSELGDGYWTGVGYGANWFGRLLEVIRSELALARQ
ncbi:NADAR family protein [Catellatospora methionotrophica]|uniref:NADAR family protein n=1 Tax=Catellatospora methionotrophica TaxID=121620 RepID=UPI0033DE6595